MTAISVDESLLAAVAIVECISTAVAAGCAIYVATRDSRWRKTGLVKQMDERISAAQQSADGWHESEKGKQLFSEVERHGVLLAVHSSELQDVATKEDVARIEGLVRRSETKIDNASDGVDRIEGILLRKALGAEP